MKRIEGRARTVRELLDSTKYTVDFYQREYAWQERQVRELLDDLTGKFLDFYDASHARDAVEQYVACPRNIGPRKALTSASSGLDWLYQSDSLSETDHADDSASACCRTVCTAVS